jgi:hypothetical protein
MAHPRTIKPSFFQDDRLAELSPLERLAFIGMWTIADDEGWMEYRSKQFKNQILPYDECDFDLIIDNLEIADCISIWPGKGKVSIQINEFDRYQNLYRN